MKSSIKVENYHGKKYRLRFVMDYNAASGLDGFVLDKHLGTFDGGMDMGLFFHDIFEHFFEFTNLYHTSKESQAGECVAMGIRAFFLENSNLVQDFASTNKYRGDYWNILAVMSSQVRETQEEVEQHLADGDEYLPRFPNDFDFRSVDLEIEDMFWILEFEDGYRDLKQFGEKHPELFEDIKKAFNYGFALGRFLFEDRLALIDAWCGKLVDFIEKMQNTGIWEPEYLQYATFDVRVGQRSITGKFWDGEKTHIIFQNTKYI